MFTDPLHEHEISDSAQKSLFKDFSLKYLVCGDRAALLAYLKAILKYNESSFDTLAIITPDRRTAQCIEWSISSYLNSMARELPEMPLATYTEERQKNIELLNASLPEDPWVLSPDDDFWKQSKQSSPDLSVQKYQQQIGIVDHNMSKTFGSSGTRIVSIGTIQLLKGHEFDTVVFVGNDRFVTRGVLNDSQLWTAMSRGKKHIRVVLPEYSTYASLFQQIDGLQEYGVE